MKQKKNAIRTYLLGNVSAPQRERFYNHMDALGFESTQNAGEFESGIRKIAMVTASINQLESHNQLPMHSHTFMEIFQYISDSRVEYLIGTSRYILQKGDIVCIPPGTCHQVLHYEPQDKPCVRNLIAIAPSFLDYLGWRNQEEYYLIRTSGQQLEYMGHLCDMCIQESTRQDIRWRDALCGYASVLLCQILRSNDATIKAEKNGIFEEILVYIDSNLSQKINLMDTAQHFYISDRTINREFRKNLGISFYQYVTHRRLLRARNMIYNGVPLEEVCSRCGFADYPTFYRAFKKEYGISPRQMRQMDVAAE